MFWLVLTTVIASMMAIIMIFVRLKAAKKPTSMKKIILPPLFMSTGALMFFFPAFQVSCRQVLEAIIVGVIFSIFLIRTSKFEIRNDEIYLIPSKSFAAILFGLLFVRIIIKLIVGSHVSVGETGGMFFLLAFGMILTWRMTMLYQFYKMKRRLRDS